MRLRAIRERVLGEDLDALLADDRLLRTRHGHDAEALPVRAARVAEHLGGPGEIQQLDADHPVTELWQVINGSAKGRRDAKQITLFDSVGFAIEDFSALRYIRDKVKNTDFFYELDMLADPDDPRDLFGMVLRAAPVAEETA